MIYCPHTLNHQNLTSGMYIFIKLIIHILKAVQNCISYINFIFENRFVAMHYAANVFPFEDAPSRYLLLLACGDDKHEISTEAMKVLYNIMYKNESDKQDSNQILLADFQKLVIYIYSKMQTRMPTSSSGKVNVESKVLPYSITIFTQVINLMEK